MQMPSLHNTLLFLGEIAGIISALTIIILFMSKTIKKLTGFFQLKEKLDLIYGEFKTNSGKSLKDQLNNIEDQQKLNTKTIKNIFSRMKWVFDHKDYPMFETDNDGQYVWVNEAFLRLTGRPNNEVMGAGWKNIICHQIRKNLINSWETSVKEKIDFEEEYHITNKNGKCFKSNCVANKTENGYIGKLSNVEECEM